MGPQQDAQDACELLTSRAGRAGAAFYRLGEIHRLRGEFTGGRSSLLACERVRTNATARTVTASARSGRHRSRGRVDPECSPRHVCKAARARILAAAVEILLVADDLEGARAADTEFSRDRQLHWRAASVRRLRTRRGRGSPCRRRYRALRHRCGRPCEIWRDLEMPYEEAKPVCCWRLSVNGGAIRTAAGSSSMPRDGCSSSSTPSRAWRGWRAIGPHRASIPRLAQRARVAGPAPACGRQVESGHCRRAVHQRENRRPTRQ